MLMASVDQRVSMARDYGERHGIPSMQVEDQIALSEAGVQPNARVTLSAILAGEVVPVERGEGDGGD
jgi:hypothetical protein